MEGQKRTRQGNNRKRQEKPVYSEEKRNSDEKQNIEETSSTQDVAESRSEYDRLLLLVKTGNVQAFCEFYEKTKSQVYRYAFQIMRHAQDTEEVVQETYLKIWKEAASYESNGKPMAWVFTIARNYCYMSLRKRQRLSEESLEEIQEQEGSEEPGALCQEIELAPERQTLMDALMQLNEKERQIVLLHKVSGMKHREIAEEFDMPISTVLSVYHRAMKKLWERIEKNG